MDDVCVCTEGVGVWVGVCIGVYMTFSLVFY